MHQITTVMAVLWVLYLLCLSGMIHVQCETSKDSVTFDDVLQTLLDLESSVSSASSEHLMADQPDDPEPGVDFGETPVLHAIPVRPSVIRTLAKLEEIVPITTEEKLRVLDNLIDNVYRFASVLPLFNCSSKKQWIELFELGVGLMESQYVIAGSSKCINQVLKRKNPSRFGMLPENLYPSTKKPRQEPGDDCVTEKQCSESTSEHSSCCEKELKEFAPFAGSVRGIPGVHYPDYADIPITNFSCADKKVPGFYADLDTGCQVFHVCYEHRRESFLCPIGTVFNQPILACDYWYSSNCSQAPLYYDTIKKDGLKNSSDTEVDDLVSVLIKSETEVVRGIKETEVTLEDITPFLPVKATVTELKPEPKFGTVQPVPEDVDLLGSEIFEGIITSATKLTSKTRDAVAAIPEPEEKYETGKPEKFYTKSKIPLTKAKMAAVPLSKAAALKAAVPLAATAKITAAAVPIVAAKVAKSKIAATVPIAAKAKLAAAAVPVMATKGKFAAAAAVPVMATKGKFAAAAAAVPVMATKGKLAAAAAAVPVMATKGKFATTVPIAAKAKVAAVPAAKMAISKAKLAAVSPLAVKAKVLPKVAAKAKMASVVPIAKAKMLAPVMKGKLIASAGTPLKAKVLGLPLVKSKLAGSIPLAKIKLAKAAAISPLTKKALALGYMKLLKAKKLALMG